MYKWRCFSLLLVINILLIIPFESKAKDSSLVQGGVVKSSYEVEIKARANGFVSFVVPISSTVKKGDKLVVIGCKQKETEVAIAKAKVKLKYAEYNRRVSLNKQGVISQSDLEVANSEYEIARAEEKAFKARANTCIIKSLKSGVIVEQYVRNGAYVSEGDLLLRVVDNQNLFLEFFALDSNYDQYAPGKKLTVELGDDSFITAVVKSRGNYINKNGTFMVVADILPSQNKTVFSGMRVVIKSN